MQCAELVSTRRAVPKTEPKFLSGPARRTLHSRGTEECGREALGKYSTGDRRGAKRDPQKGDRGILGDTPESLQVLSLGGEILRRIVLMDTMGKLLEEMILHRLQGRMVGESGLSKNQFVFWKGRSTVDAI